MKRIYFLLLLIILLIPAAGCRRASDNGKIDGFWKIQEITYNTDSESVFPRNLFISVQLELLQLQNPSPSGALTGVLHYHDGDKKIGVDFRNNPSAELLAKYGFAADAQDNTTTYCTLDIERLDSKHLVLRSPIAVIRCAKF